MAKVLHRPKVEHSCLPGKTRLTVTQEEADRRNAESREIGDMFRNAMAGTFIVDDLDLRSAPGGTTIECEDCGKVWVKDPVRWIHNKRSSRLNDNSWHPETWWERRKRARAND